MNWGREDFIAAALLLSFAGILVALVMRHVKGRMQRVGLFVLIAFAFLAVWAELAVGILH